MGTRRQVPDDLRNAAVREALMDAAERLVALYGEDGASARAITQAAGQRHNSAITYHFGSRGGLLDAVWVRGSAHVDERRRRFLNQSARHHRQKQPGVILDLVRAYIVPLALHLDASTPSYWARFNEAALQRYPLAIPSQLRTGLAEYPQPQPLTTLLDVFEEMQKLTCGGRQPDASLRVSMMVRMATSTFAASEREAENHRADLTATHLTTHLTAGAVHLLAGD